MRRVFENITAVLVSSLLCLPSVTTKAQTGVNSPYSRYGMGQLSDPSSGMIKAMGGIGAGFRYPNTVNIKNPASYSSVDTLTFIADLGFAIQNGNYNENGVSINARNAYIDHLTMQFRILPKVGMTVGFMPFANVGYGFSKTEPVRRDEDGEITSTITNSGTGGVRQFMGGLGWRPTKWLSVGANAYYLSGDINHYITNTYSSSEVQSREKSYYAEMSAFRYDMGIQGTINRGERSLVLGATFAPAQTLKSETYKTDRHSVSDTTFITDAFSMPELMSAGFTYKWNKGMIGADVSYQTWSKASFFGEKTGSNRISAAIGYMRRPDEMSRNILKRTAYEFGVNFSQAYYKVGNNNGPLQFGVSAGFSLPFSSAYNSMSYLHVSGEFVRVQPMAKGMITENYVRINIGVTFMERWFMKLMVD
ncbi:MAG: hypothetical protein J6T97_01510 [Bacteroidaceae bacterium]|nr:hypothetical protein [Bacteroidaceae bacterium]